MLEKVEQNSLSLKSHPLWVALYMEEFEVPQGQTQPLYIFNQKESVNREPGSWLYNLFNRVK